MAADEKTDGKEQPREERQKMEVGGTADATVKFKDPFEKDVKVKSSQWAASGNVVVQPDEKDPTKAKLLAVGPGPSTIRAQGEGEDGGHAEARVEVLVLPKGEAVTGEITLSIQPAPAKKEAPKEKEPAHATGASSQHTVHR